MNKKIVLSLIISLISLSLKASTPTTEGLFRNANNAEISANLIMVKLILSSKVSNQLLETPVGNLPEEKITEGATEEEQKFYVKFLLSEDGDNRVQAIQAIYTDPKMTDSSLFDVRYFSNLKNKIKTGDKAQGLFYATLSSLTLNRSEEMAVFLKVNSKNFKTNEELIDREKMALYEKYKRYLSLVKEDETLKETMDNPMKPNDDEGKELVKAIKKRPFMNKDPNVSLVKDQNGFFWKAENDVLTAIFENKTMRLERLSYGNLSKNIKLSLDDYILFDGSHELPKTIKIDTPAMFVEMRTSSLTHLMLRNKKMPQRYAEYKKLVQESNKKEDLQPIFLMR
ncbi:MAG: hypothetical protein NXH75_04900 [Halobacteriovoraceae bacterium]|nr:hypothetical protein [Halobacteriovoraceae bacterium]